MNDQTAVKLAKQATRRAGGLWGVADIAEAIGSSEQAVQDRLRRGTLPEPTFIVGRNTRVWLARSLPAEVRRRAK